MAASKDKKADSTAALPFEKALDQLESLVREMESDQIPLEDLIHKYEEGSQLYRVCEKRLDEAQGRIEQIRKKRNGEVVLEPFGEAGAKTQPASADTTLSDTQEDGQLF